MYSTGQAAERLDVSRQTVMRWCKQLADHLSTDANPDAGTARRFDDHDVAVLTLAAKMRRDRASWTQIREALDSADVDALADEQEPGEPEQNATSALVPLDLARAWLAPLQQAIDALQEHNAMLLAENRELRERLDARRGWFARLLGL